MNSRSSQTADSASALILGATGVVGRECIRQLTAQRTFARITRLTRRALPDDVPTGKLETVVVDFDRLDERSDELRATHVFCAMGTTMKHAGTAARFRQVDLDYPAHAAALAKAAGARHFLLVSSVGADAASRHLYLRVKGELERAVTSLGFFSVTIIRPSVLIGERQEFRFRERLAARLSWAFPAQYRAVHVRDVVGVLVRAALEDQPGVHVIENRKIPRVRGVA